jgi:hypothetical protein
MPNVHVAGHNALPSVLWLAAWLKVSFDRETTGLSWDGDSLKIFWDLRIQQNIDNIFI